MTATALFSSRPPGAMAIAGNPAVPWRFGWSNWARSSPSLEPTHNGRAAWPFQGRYVHCRFQGQAAALLRAAQLKR